MTNDIERCCDLHRPLCGYLIVAAMAFLYLSLETQRTLAVFCCFPAIMVIHFVIPERRARILNLLILVFFLPRFWQCLSGEKAVCAGITLLLVSLFSAAFVSFLNRQQTRLRELAVTDPLTGVFNRLLLDTFLERSALLAERNGRPVSLITLDLDEFKAINDSFGHAEGDRVLSELGRMLLKRVRRSDAVFRLGGEEFLLLLLDTDLAKAENLAEELRGLLRERRLLPNRRVTASFGVATIHPSEDWEDWLRRSDLATYTAKRRGRDQVALAP